MIKQIYDLICHFLPILKYSCTLLSIKVYPPCDTTQFREIPRTADSAMKQFRVVSLGQFRPEKDHPLQIRDYMAR